MTITKDLADARHLVAHAGQDAEQMGAALSQHLKALNEALVDLKANQLTIARLTAPVVALLVVAAWVETMAKIGACGCESRVERAAVDESRVPPSQEQIEARKVLPLRRFVMVGPRKPGDAA